MKFVLGGFSAYPDPVEAGLELSSFAPPDTALRSSNLFPARRIDPINLRVFATTSEQFRQIAR
jgi:hypothetical protein